MTSSCKSDKSDEEISRLRHLPQTGTIFVIGTLLHLPRFPENVCEETLMHRLFSALPLLLLCSFLFSENVKLFYAEKTLGFQHGDETIYVILTAKSENDVHYRAKYVSPGKVTQNKEGALFEKYERVEQPNGKFRTVDRGSSLKIAEWTVPAAGGRPEHQSTIAWSKADATFGYLYYSAKECTLITKERAFFDGIE
jgi:hypothetical protein